MIAGTLEVQMLMNLARLSQDIQTAKGHFSTFTRDVERMAGQMKTALGALGVGLSAGAIIAFFNHTKDAIAGMKDLANEAGTTAERMSRFEAPTRSAGLALSDTANAMFRMSKAAVEARDPASRAAQALASIGISTAQLKGLKPDEMFELAARQVAKYGDGLQKNAVMQELFNKSGREMNKLVKEIAEAGELHATVLEEDAEEAKKFNDQTLELKMTSERFWRGIVSDGLPALNSIIKAFIDGRREAGLWQGVIAAATEMFVQGSGLPTLEKQLKDVNSQIEIAARAKERLAREGTTFLGMERTGEIKQAENLNALLARRAELEHQISQVELEAQNRRALAGLANKPPEPNFDPAAAARAAQALAAYKSENAELDKQIAKLRNVGELEAYIEKLDEERFKFLSPAQKKDLAEKEALLLKLQAEIQARQMLFRSASEYISAIERQRDIEQQARDGARDALEQAQFDLTLLGKTAGEQEKLNALRAIDLELRRQIAAVGVEDGDFTTAAQNAEIERLRAIAEARKAGIGGLIDTKTALTEQLSVWNQLGDIAGGFFSHLMEGGKSAFNYLKQQAKQFLAELIAIFAKRWLLQLGASAMGGSAGGALAAQAEGVGANSLSGMAGSAFMSGAGAVLSNVGTWGGSLGLASGAGSGIVGGLGANMATLGVAMEGGAAAVGGAAEVIAAAIPVIGWIVAIAAVLYAIFGSKGGGPKNGGSFFSGGMVPGTDNGRFFTPSEGDSTLQTAVVGLQAGYGDLARRLGGKPGDFNFGLGYDNDPNGSAQSRVSSMITGANGDILYKLLDHSMDDKEVPAAIALEMKRMLVVALKNTDFGEDINKVFAGAGDIANLTSEQIDALIAKAREMYSVIQGIKTLGLTGLDPTALQAFALEGESLMQTFQRVGGAWLQLQDAFTSEDTKLANASANLAAFASDIDALGMKMPTTREAWLDMMRGLDLSTEAGRELFARMMALAPAFDAVSNAAAAMMDSFDQLMGTIRPGYTSALQGGQLDSAIGQFMGANAWTHGMSPADFLVQIRTITRDDFSHYSRANQQLILQITDLDHRLNGTTSALTDNTAALLAGPSASGHTPQENAFEDYYRNQGRRSGLAGYLNGLILNPQATTLDPMQRLAEAERQYNQQLAGGLNSDHLQESAEAYRQAARDAFASSSAYVDIFNRIFHDLAGLAEVPDANERIASASERSANRLDGVYSVLMRIADGQSSLEDTTRDVGDRVERAVGSMDATRR